MLVVIAKLRQVDALVALARRSTRPRFIRVTAPRSAGNLGGHGSEIDAMIKRGEIDQARAYCEIDCLNLFALYVRWALLSGRTNCLVAERCWDRVRWAIEEYAWRFERVARRSRPRRS
jgi:hypothetical protein